MNINLLYRDVSSNEPPNLFRFRKPQNRQKAKNLKVTMIPSSLNQISCPSRLSNLVNLNAPFGITSNFSATACL